MRLHKLLSGAMIEFSGDIPDIEVTDIVTDSRRANAGCMFICIDGLHTDSHNFIKNAVDAGASVIVMEKGRDECVGGAATVKVSNTRRASAFLYNSWHGDPAKKLKIIGVTGTNGKTSVCRMLYEIFEKNGKRCGLIGTIGCYSHGCKIEYSNSDPLANMTTPDPNVLYGILARMLNDGVEYVFMEATSHASALCKLDALSFDTLVFTNLTRDHLDFHGNMDNYLAAKAKLFEKCRVAVVNADDENSRKIMTRSRAEKILLCSTQNRSCDISASDIRYGGKDGYSMRVVFENAGMDAIIEVPLVGRFSPTNSLLAIAVAKEYGIADSELVHTMRTLSPVPGRMERVSFEKEVNFSVYIDYAHTPDALENILLSARDIARQEDEKFCGRVILLFGCGGERDRGKRREMGAIATRLADFVIVTSDNSRGEEPCKIIEDIYKGINKEKEHIIIVERESAIRFAVSEAREGDVLILAGKGHEKYEIGRDGRVPFDEIEILRDAVLKRKI